MFKNLLLRRTITGQFDHQFKHYLNKNSSILIKQQRFNSSLIEKDEFTFVSNSDAIATTRHLSADLPLIINRTLKYPEMFDPEITPPKEAWVEEFTKDVQQKLAIIKLHPKIFGHFPRPDLVYKNLQWQQDIHWVNFLSVKVKNELSGSNKKPWPQKGTGRARHGSKRGPQWKNGGWVQGPRGPMTKYYQLNYFERVRGLCSLLTAKLAQNDLKIVKNLENFDSDDPNDLKNALEERGWGPSCLIVDTVDIFPRNISLAAHLVDHINLIPLYGLNVHSMLKHETLILTLNAVNELEDRILYAFNRTDIRNLIYKHEPPKIIPDETPEFEGCRWVSNLHNKDWI